jgi:hypothetical protein
MSPVSFPERLEFSRRTDRFHDYCLWEYRPEGDPEGKFAPSNLLYHTFHLTGVDDRAYELIASIRAAIGAGHTVWGVKYVDGRLAWEFYFYDYRRRDRQRSISRVLEAIAPLVGCTIQADERLHYFMFSLDFDPEIFAGQKPLSEVNMYIGNPGSVVSAGISYFLRPTGTSLGNFYSFFDPAKQLDDLVGKIRCSAFVSPDLPIEQILWPELIRCRTVCIANKHGHDCVYFSEVNIDQLLHFLVRTGYPPNLISFVSTNRSKLDHLHYDVGIDYRMEGDKLVILKTGYYGTF